MHGQLGQPMLGNQQYEYGQSFQYYEQQRIQELKAKHKQQKTGVAKERANGIIFWFCFLACFDSFLWLVPLTGNSWHAKQFTGFGVKFLQVRTSLVHQEVEFTCGKNALEDQVCKVLRLMEGKHPIMKAKGISCSLSVQACRVMEQLYWSSFVPLFSFILAAMFQLFGAFFLYYYWKVEPIARVREWALNFWVAAAFIGFLGMVIFTVTSPNLSDLPKGWMAQAVGSGWMKDAFGLKSVSEMPFGWCYFVAWFSVAFSSGTVVGWVMLFKAQKKEEYVYDCMKESKRQDLNEQVARNRAKAQWLEENRHYVPYLPPPPHLEQHAQQQQQQQHHHHH